MGRRCISVERNEQCFNSAICRLKQFLNIPKISGHTSIGPHIPTLAENGDNSPSDDSTCAAEDVLCGSTTDTIISPSEMETPPQSDSASIHAVDDDVHLLLGLRKNEEVGTVILDPAPAEHPLTSIEEPSTPATPSFIPAAYNSMVSGRKRVSARISNITLAKKLRRFSPIRLCNCCLTRRLSEQLHCMRVRKAISFAENFMVEHSKERRDRTWLLSEK